ncbi:hypothetical protein OOK41_22360 [Micromonospora sp. NBC_01655]|uniref:hypothetical protein n=1 Tax=Micromonospora sp. NBC_01655 TaxID=2975983 RepID=UPI002252C66E|nr:hypothetical protein [Micromonospora sp. NBC_01655]MCX4473022.1 hypothetical protein [Micromonospora sp. NBC_01655]
MSSTLNTAAGKRKVPIRAYILTVVVGVALATAFGVAAALFREESRVLSFGVFTAVALGPALSLSWLLLVSRYTVSLDRHAGENVENLWITNATSGAGTDTFAACGIALAAIAVTGLDISGTAALGGVLVLMLVDTGVRYLVEKRRSR